MKKDITIPKVKEVYIAVVQEKHLEYQTQDWNAYIINNSDKELDTVLILSQGYSESKMTPPMRHSIAKLPARSFAKIEYLQEDVLELNNSFKLSFFQGNQMFDKTYVFRKNTINTRAFQPIPLMNTNGILVK
ncbi:hypothetical protein J4050_01605 [Winogradskyella sp. DF17]|uniref:Phenylalanyl-tRNA synthetase subunit alpha n=1 Tax=Winogradskyella pelagia TaxID=2819984 RepID=A0ABS3SY74_9FLAO|nr:hypothetical protein [Winogradskyella sp. DF17]MBO3115422.1 hypothetical protein [Winogradskyella sp. DF17]